MVIIPEVLLDRAGLETEGMLSTENRQRAFTPRATLVTYTWMGALSTFPGRWDGFVPDPSLLLPSLHSNQGVAGNVTNHTTHMELNCIFPFSVTVLNQTNPTSSEKHTNPNVSTLRSSEMRLHSSHTSRLPQQKRLHHREMVI